MCIFLLIENMQSLFFRAPLDFNQKERIKRIVSLYLETIKNGNAPEYFLNNIFRWPYDTVEKDGKTGVIVPIYDKKFFFTKGRVTDEGLKGEEKKGNGILLLLFVMQNILYVQINQNQGIGSAIFRLLLTYVEE